MRPVIGFYRDAQMHWVGDGFPVRDMLPMAQTDHRADPFLQADYVGPHHFAPQAEGKALGVEAHPHKGIETVTIVYAGEVAHRDSTGAQGVIGAGEVQWMTAGRGILHEEMHAPNFVETGGDFEMLQLWVNLPQVFKTVEPGYQSYSDAQIPMLVSEDLKLRVIAGEYEGIKGPVRSFSQLNVWDLAIQAGAALTLPVPSKHRTTILVLRGAVLAQGMQIGAAETLLLESGEAPIELEAMEESLVVVLSGVPLGEPIVRVGPIVMTSKAEVRAAFAQYRAGDFGQL